VQPHHIATGTVECGYMLKCMISVCKPIICQRLKVPLLRPQITGSRQWTHAPSWSTLVATGVINHLPPWQPPLTLHLRYRVPDTQVTGDGRVSVGLSRVPVQGCRDVDRVKATLCPPPSSPLIGVQLHSRAFRQRPTMIIHFVGPSLG
jgi:hypothetical protein